MVNPNELPKGTKLKQPDGSNRWKLTKDGHDYICVPEGNKWRVEEAGDHLFRTVKEIKIAIADGELTPQGYTEALPTTATESPNDNPANEQHTWDCIHPAAHLVQAIAQGKIETTAIIMDTLDKYGYLDELGLPDASKAQREMMAHVM